MTGMPSDNDRDVANVKTRKSILREKQLVQEGMQKPSNTYANESGRASLKQLRVRRQQDGLGSED